MAVFLTKTTIKRGDREYRYFILKAGEWLPDVKAQRQRYIGYVGKEPKITRSKALKICEEKGISLEDLQSVKGLEIVGKEEDDQKCKRA